MSARLSRLVLFLCAALCLATSCSMSLKQPDPVKQYYALKAERPASSGQPTPAAPVVLKIKRINVAPSYSSREFVYKTSENSFFPDYYNLFLVAPKDNLTQVLRAWLDAAGVAKVALAGESELEAQYVLESSFSKLYADFSKPQSPVAVVEAQFFLLRDVQGRYELSISKTYRQEFPLKDRTPESLVNGYDQALQGILSDLEADLRNALTASKSAGKKP
jgi:ABC-type uncharacterized transport system auxiliary subunit